MTSGGTGFDPAHLWFLYVPPSMPPLERLTQVTEADLARMHGIGPRAIARLGDALAAAGLSFATTN